MTENDIVDLLEECGQRHLVGHLDLLPEPNRSRFLEQLLAHDWRKVAHMHASAGPQATHSTPGGMRPVRATVLNSVERETCWKAGIDMLSRGKCALVLMAGGQGSRLGFEGPKGAAPIGLPGDWTLFEMLSRRLLALQTMTGNLPWFGVMTSPENHDATATWFSNRGDPSFPGGSPQLFTQSVGMALDEKGRALLAKVAQLTQVPDGNGGIWERLERIRMLEALEKRGVEWIHVVGVDNLLTLPCDPVFLGFASRSGSPQASKTVLRTNPAEKVGVFVETSDGRPRVAEYTELPPETAAALDSDGLPIHREANIASHLVRVDLAREFAKLDLPWHLARKAVPHVDSLTAQDRSTEIVCKYERFLFDAFPAGKSMALLRVERETEFAPIKNAIGLDSPETASKALKAMHHAWRENWLRRGERSDSGDPRCPVVDPLESYSGEPPRRKSQGG